MSGPMAISYEVGGRRYVFGGVDESEVAELLPDLKRVDPSPVVIPDGLAEVRERLPVGTRVRTDRYWKRGAGTVTEADWMPGYAQWPPAGHTAHFLSHDGASVHVRFDGDDYGSWWPAHWIERLS